MGVKTKVAIKSHCEELIPTWVGMNDAAIWNWPNRTSVGHAYSVRDTRGVGPQVGPTYLIRDRRGRTAPAERAPSR